MKTFLLALRGSSAVIYSFLTVASLALARALHNDERLSFPHIVLASASLASPFTVASFSLVPLSCTQACRLGTVPPENPCGYHLPYRFPLGSSTQSASKT